MRLGWMAFVVYFHVGAQHGRPCRRPITRQLIDAVEPLMPDTLHRRMPGDVEIFATELSPAHRDTGPAGNLDRQLHGLH